MDQTCYRRPQKDEESCLKYFHDISNQNASYQTDFSDPHSCLKTIDDLTELKLQEMEVNKIHTGTYLVGTVLCEPFGTQCAEFLIEDKDGQVENVCLVNYDYLFKNLLIEPESTIAIKEPYLKERQNSKKAFYIRVDSPSDLILLESGQLNALVTSMNREELNRIGNKYFIEQNYTKSIEIYNYLLKNDKNNQNLWSNLAAAYLKLDKFQLAFDAATKSHTDKGYYRLGLAAYALKQYDEAIRAFENSITLNKNNKIVMNELENARKRHHEYLTGEYDFENIIKNHNSGLVSHDIANFSSNLIKIQDIPNKGKGIVATSYIPRGTLLVGAKAISITYTQECDEMCVMKNERNKEVSRIWYKNTLKLSKLCKEDTNLAKKIYKLYSGPTIDRNQEVPNGIVDVNRLGLTLIYNSFVSEDASVYVRAKVDDNNAGLWLMPSYFNHSCVYNCRQFFYGDVCFIFTNKDIQQNDECTISYVQVDADYELKRDYLNDPFEMKCECELCLSCMNEANYEEKMQLVKNESNGIINAASKSTKSYLRVADKSLEKLENVFTHNYKLHLLKPLKSMLTLLSMNKRDEDIPLALIKMFQIARDVDMINAVQSLLALFDFYSKRKDPNKAKEYLMQAIEYVPIDIHVQIDFFTRLGFDVKSSFAKFNEIK